jgi:hypothetical protein
VSVHVEYWVTFYKEHAFSYWWGAALEEGRDLDLYDQTTRQIYREVREEFP